MQDRRKNGKADQKAGLTWTQEQTENVRNTDGYAKR
jgi:hypothetical protein